jgi:hypothetical protein
MADFDDAVAFNATQRASMEPCTAPSVSDFEYDQGTLIWANIGGEMRIYSYDGVKIQYQVPDLGAKIDT